MILRKAHIILLFSLLQSGMMLADDTTDVVSRHLPSTLFFNDIYTQPSAIAWQPYTGIGTVSARYSYNDNSDYHLLRAGENGYSYGLNTGGIAKQSRAIFWGKASYSYSKKSNIQWSDVSEYFRLGPYQIADSIGGDMKGETYYLSGGFSLNTGRWSWAAEAGYRGGNEYRKTDPRPKTIISDLFGRISGSLSIGEYQTGITLNGGIYQQHVEITVRGSMDKSYFYAMRGFGLYDILQSDYGSSFNWLYEGGNYGITAFLLPHKGLGWFALGSIKWENIKSESNPGTSNSMYPFEFKTADIDISLGYTISGIQRKALLKASWRYQKGTGTESLYQYIIPPNATLYEYHLLSKSDKYARNLHLISVSGLQEWYNQPITIWARIDAGMNLYTEKYMLPEYRINYTHLNMHITGGFDYIWERSTFAAELTIGYHHLLDSEKIIPMNNTIFMRSMYPDLRIMESSPVFAGIRLDYEHFFISQTRWFVSAGLNDLFYERHHAFTLNITTGIRL